MTRMSLGRVAAPEDDQVSAVPDLAQRAGDRADFLEGDVRGAVACTRITVDAASDPIGDRDSQALGFAGRPFQPEDDRIPGFPEDMSRPLDAFVERSRPALDEAVGSLGRLLVQEPGLSEVTRVPGLDDPVPLGSQHDVVAEAAAERARRVLDEWTISVQGFGRDSRHVACRGSEVMVSVVSIYTPAPGYAIGVRRLSWNGPDPWEQGRGPLRDRGRDPGVGGLGRVAEIDEHQVMGIVQEAAQVVECRIALEQLDEPRTSAITSRNMVSVQAYRAASSRSKETWDDFVKIDRLPEEEWEELVRLTQPFDDLQVRLIASDNFRREPFADSLVEWRFRRAVSSGEPVADRLGEAVRGRVFE